MGHICIETPYPPKGQPEGTEDGPGTGKDEG